MAEKRDNYVFNYPWDLVMKGLWIKYPNSKMDFVKSHQVVGMEILPNGSLKVQKLSSVTFARRNSWSESGILLILARDFVRYQGMHFSSKIVTNFKF